MNFGELQTLVWSWLDDPNAGYFTPAQVQVWINNAQKELQKKLIRAGQNYYVEKMSGLLTANQDTYCLPTDFKKCHKLEIVSGGTAGTVTENRNTLTWVTLMQLENYPQGTGLPCVYNIRRNLVTFRPIPDQAYTVYLYQSYQVADMVNAQDVPDCPEDYTEYIAVLATIDGFMKDQRSPSDFLIAKQKMYEENLVADAVERDESSSRRVVVTEDSGWGVLF